MNILLTVAVFILGFAVAYLFLMFKKLKTSPFWNNNICEALIGKSPDGIFIVSEGKFVYANGKILEMTGYSCENFCSLTPSQIIHHTKNEVISNNFWEVMAGIDSQQQCEMDLVSENGKIIKVDASFNFVDYGKKRAVYVALRDITSRKEFEEKLSRNDQYIYNIINCLPNIVVGTDSQANIIFINSETERFINMEFSKVFGKKIFDVMPQFSEQFAHIENVVNKNSVKDFSMVEINSGSESLYYHLKLIPFTGNYRKSVFVIVTNITELVKFENIVVAADRIFSSADFLSNFISNVKVELNEFEKVLEEFICNLKSLGKDDIRGDALHERIIGAARGLADMKTGIERAKKSVEQLNDFTPTGGLSFEKHSINKIVEDVVQVMKSDPFFLNSYNLSNIDFLSEYDSNLPDFLCNPGEIVQALKKFLATFLESYKNKNELLCGNLKIIFKTYKSEGYVCISIEDNGGGFSCGNVGTANSHFFSNSSGGSKTSDFGVNVANYIIKSRYKGELEVLSKPGAGTKLIIKLRG